MMAEPIEKIRVDGPSPEISALQLSEIGAETFVQSFGHLYAETDLQKFLHAKHNADAYQRLIDDREYAIWVATETAGQIVGYLVAGPCDLPVDDMPPNSGELIRFYLLRDYQGSGLGRRMLDPALVWLHEQFDHVFLSVYSENVKAQRLYERYGFEKVQKYFFMVGDHADPEFIMKRTARPFA